MILSQSNLALLQTYGPNAHRIYNYLLEETTKQVEKASEDLKQLTVDVNRERKNDQVRLCRPCILWPAVYSRIHRSASASN